MVTIPPYIAQRIQDAVARGGGFAIDEEARQHGAIALMGTIGTIWMLRPDGSVWDADADSDKPFQPLDERCHLMALAVGVERYPWLRELLPQRPADAIDCATCKGTGKVGPTTVVYSGAICPACDALGWRCERPKSEV